MSRAPRKTPIAYPVLPKERPLPPGGVRYQLSKARRMDVALQRGCKLAALAKRLGVKTIVVRVHIADRVATGRWRFEVTDGYPRAGKIVATAGRLHRNEERT
jgi:hypothetical protein